MSEHDRLAEDARREKNWKRWGPYLSERQWGTVREDYSADGTCWDYFPHDHARSRAYRWGEDGLLGISDREARLCFSVALWNEKDSILKERLFGVGNPDGNHGEDVKELYYYLDATPTHSYLKALYKYPQAAFPYERLISENRRRGKSEPEFELIDTGVLDGNRYFDVTVEYAKAAPDDILIRLTAENRGPDAAPLHVLPTLWFRNTWSWGRAHEGDDVKPRLSKEGSWMVGVDHATLGRFRFAIESPGATPRILFTENETNTARLFNTPNAAPYVKDAFHSAIVNGDAGETNLKNEGTKVAVHEQAMIPAGGRLVLRYRLSTEAAVPAVAFGAEFDRVFDDRRAEADAFYAEKIPAALTSEERNVARQGYAGLLWSKQFYHYIVKDWLDGDAKQPAPPPSRKNGRNSGWPYLYARDVISIPDKWEYPWFAAWDLAFHMIPFGNIDPTFTKEQLLLFLREWYMHPNGKIPAYEFAFDDVNPPVHAWACWRVYKMTGPSGGRDRLFLARTFQKLLLNFTWWVNRKDVSGKNLFAGGFLGLDNIGVFDRSKPLPTGGYLEQADGTAWMAFFCGTMMSMALELARTDHAYEDLASKFFEHFVAIVDASNTIGGGGLWHEEDGFYYDQLLIDGIRTPLRVRSLVGVIPVLAAEVLEEALITQLPGFQKRMKWFLANRQDLSRHITYMESNHGKSGNGHRLLAVPSRERLERVLKYILDENEFLSPYGLRSVSRYHKDHPYELDAGGTTYQVRYEPGESTSGSFGGNSNWRGPIWFPVNYLLIEALERYHHFYGDDFQVECPTGSGKKMNLHAVSRELAGRLARLFLPGADGRRPYENGPSREGVDLHSKDLVLFYEYFHGDTGQGLGASHQTGWTALAIRCLEQVAQARNAKRK